MDTLCSESILAKRNRVMIIRKLVEGHDAATQLKLLLQKPFRNNTEEEDEEDEDEEEEESLSSSIDELVGNVQRSFTESLSVLTSSISPSEKGCGRNLPCSGEIGSPAMEHSGNDPHTEECKKRSSPPSKNRGRGCYKRRRNAESWTKVSPTVDDDHAWRKYGQKDILNSKFPRSYFRCSRKYDRGCHATKQVQRTQDNPEMYQTTYIGFHTCQAATHGNYSHPDYSNNKVLLINQQDHHPIVIKQENSKEDTTTTPSGGGGDDIIMEHKLLDPTIWSDLKDFDGGTTSLHYYSTVHFGTHDHEFHFDDDDM